MEPLHWVLRIGDVNDHRSVGLRYVAVQRILDLASRHAVQVWCGMQARERDHPSIRILDEIRLVGPATLQADVSHEFHVPLLAALVYGQRAGGAQTQRHSKGGCSQCIKAYFTIW